MRSCLSFFFQLFCCSVLAQQMQFDNAGSFLGMPSLESYNIMQDSKGYLWFATEQGLCRYDGTNVMVFDRKNGLPEGAVYAMVEDNKGVLWMLTSKNRILVYKNDRLSESVFSRQFSRLNQRNEIPYSMVLLPDGTFYINTDRSTFVAYPETGKLERVPQKSVRERYWFIWNQGLLLPFHGWQYNPVSAGAKTAPKSYPIAVLKQDSSRVFLSATQVPKYWHRMNTFNTPKGHFFPFDENKLARIDREGNYQIWQFPHRVLWVFCDSDGDLWIGFLKDGISCYRNGDLYSKPIVSLPDCSVSGITEDFENNIWCTTLEKGVFVCRNKNILNYFNVDGLDKPLDLLSSCAGKTFFSSETHELIILDQAIHRKRLYHKSKEPLSDISLYNGDWLLGGKELLGKLDMATGIVQPIFIKPNMEVSSQRFKVFADTMYGIKYSDLVTIEPSGKSASLQSLFDPMNDLVFLSSSQVLCGGKNGLYRADLKTGSAVPIKGVADPVVRLAQTPSGIWAITKGSGLYLYKDSVVTAVNGRYKISATVMNDMVYNDNCLWIGSNSGLIKLDLHTQKAQTFGTAHGFPSNLILKLSLTGNEMFLSTPEGVCSFNVRKDIVGERKPRIFLNSVLSNGKRTDFRPGIVFPHDKNSIECYFDALSFKSGQARLRYKLRGHNLQFTETNGNKIAFENLDPGHYELIVFALNNLGVQSASPVVLRFEIARPFWLEWWFIVLLLVAGTLLVWAVAAKIISGIKKKESQKTDINKRIADSQLAALQAQMNPHFIFNSINSIQNYILNQNETEAYGYLAKFSKLVRLVLHNSQEQLLCVHDELETVKLYVELEQMRFNESFDFSVHIRDGVDVYEMMVPTMIIQPYIENAIWHGLMHLDGKRRGQIVLSLGIDNGLIVIEIRDNGIGREMSARYRSQHTHKPVAMQLTEKRIALVNDLYKDKAVRVEITDLYDETGQASGTQVRIYLPTLNFD